MPEAPEAKVRARVARWALRPRRWRHAAKDLSGGEKARLLMGLAAFDAPNLLILDEPTNHLDIDSRRALIEALNDYPGAVILISHDRYLIEATVDRLWLVNNGTVSTFEGDMDEYRSLVVASGKKKEEKPQLNDDAASKADQRKLNAEKRASLAPLKKKINEIESLTGKLEKLIQALDVELADPVLYEKAPAKAADKAKQRGEAAQSLLPPKSNGWSFPRNTKRLWQDSHTLIASVPKSGISQRNPQQLKPIVNHNPKGCLNIHC
jgi:ATP-binding cassette subfamily F protein 3